jgi:hypothetical protein
MMTERSAKLNEGCKDEWGLKPILEKSEMIKKFSTRTWIKETTWEAYWGSGGVTPRIL